MTASAAASERAEVAERFVAAIEECATAVAGQDYGSGPDFAARLAAVWAVLIGADPELAARTSRYTALEEPREP